MNGVELPVRHGFPLRALIPGRYGEENAKWLTRVELTDHFVAGLYAEQGWYYGPLHTMSRIDRPQGHLALGQRSFAALRMTKPDGLLSEMYWPQGLQRRAHSTTNLH